MTDKRSNYIRHTMNILWINWVVGVGALAFELLIPRILPLVGLSKTWLPFPVFLMAYFLAYYERRIREKRGAGFTGLLHVAGLTLFWSALIMVIINVLNSKMLLDDWIDWSNTNKDIPFITCLIMFPVLTFVSFWVMVRGYVQSMPEGYRAKSGIVPGNGAVATLLSIESRYQVRALFYISIVLNLVEWWYYFIYYFNTNMNTPDLFFFNWMPIALYFISLLFMAGRYRSLAAMIGPIAFSSRGNGAEVRFIIVSGDRILLLPDSYGRWDTPAITNLSPLDAHNEVALKSALERISGRDNFELRYLYETGINDEVEILHYAAFFPEECSFENWKDAKWMTVAEIDRIIKSAGMAAEFTDEIYRIFTITLAWKTYDIHGKRIYPIKNYRPSFRIQDMPKWDVDYSDLHWLDVAKHNQDKPFYHTRRLWRRITGGKA